jgi:HK97 family phage portal protein
MFGMSESDPRAAGGRGPLDDYWYNPVAPAGKIVVNTRSVAQIPEVYDCLQVIAQTIAALPLMVYKRKPGGAKERADYHPIYDLLHTSPNPLATAYEFRHQMTWDLCLHRNAFAEIKEGPRGPIDTLTRIDPETMWVVKGRNSNSDYVFEIRNPDGSTRRLDKDQVFHLRAPPMETDNILGRSIIEDGARTFARALALQDYAGRFFENDATPGGVVTIAGKLSPELAQEFKKKWQNQFTGQNRHKTAVLDSGGTYTAIDVQNDKAQFIETYREVALQCLRFWRMQPHKVGILDKATFSNIEQQSLEFVTDTLLPWLVSWEQAIGKELILLGDRFYAEHNVGGLLRGDTKSRYEAYAIGRAGGWLSADEIRSWENMNPIPGGDKYLQPMNMQPLDKPAATPAAFAAAIDSYIALQAKDGKLIEAEASDALR